MGPGCPSIGVHTRPVFLSGNKSVIPALFRGGLISINNLEKQALLMVVGEI